MALKKVWMSSDTGNYTLHVLGGSLGIVMLTMLLVIGGTILSFRMNWPQAVSSLLLCLGVTVLAVVLSLHLRRKVVQDATIMLLTEHDRLYAMDTRRLSDHGHNLPGYVAGTLETQRFLNRLAQMPYVPAGADEVLKVERIKENSSHYAISCRVRHPNRRVIRRTYFIIKGFSEEDSLLRALERRKNWKFDLDQPQNRKPLLILLSALTLICLAALCVLSHPATARIPHRFYFPCLGAAFLDLFFLVYLSVRQSRGE